MKRTITRTACSLVAGFGLVACVSGGTDELDGELEPEDRDPIAQEDDGKFEAWNRANNPAFVDPNFVYYAHQLPLEGGGPTPIPGDYWAIARDNINAKWDNGESPASKYAKAFNKADVEEQVSQAHGVKDAAWRKACTTNSDCSDLKDGSICASSYDGNEKRCIPTWWGICHGWAPYALSERPARNPVTRTAADGTQVTFYPGDLEGLMSLLYTEVPTKFISSRCNKDEPPTDSNGRLLDGECRDMNPGSWHVITTNLMGLRKQGFVLDQTYDDEVWNQPGWKYRVTNADGDKLREISKEQAVALLGLNMKMTELLPTTEVKKGEQKTGEYTAAAQGDYLVKMTGTGDADLYVKKGSAATESAYDCRPYGSTSLEECTVSLAAGETVHWMVSGYGDSSSVQLGVAVPGEAGDYTYNTAARKFYHVEMDFTFVVESRPARTSHVDSVDSYAQTRHYSYILEADEYGKVIGGEWIGESRITHPDFAWWPTGKPAASKANGRITYAEVKALNDEAAGVEPEAETTVTVMENQVVCESCLLWSSRYAPVNVEPGFTKLVVRMTGTGNADLYVRKDKNPTVWSYACKSTGSTSDETCEVTLDRATGGTYIVRARSRTQGTTVTVTAEKVK